MSATSERILEARNLTKWYNLGGGFSRIRITAVNEATFEMGSRGPEIFALAGESGSGKTTIARMILGFLDPSAGTIRVRGHDVTKLRRRRERIAFLREVQGIFQDPFDTFNPLKRIDSYLYETAWNFGVATGRAEAERAVSEALESVGLSLQEIARRYPHELSGGQAQRTSVARALITHPSLLVADEPVSMVDASLRMSIVNLLSDFKKKHGISVLYITHDLATAYYVADRIAIMLRGSIIEEGEVERVLDHPLHPYTIVLRESVPKPDPEKRWTSDIELSSLEVKEYGRAGCKFAGRCPQEMASCRSSQPPTIEREGRRVRCNLYA